MNKFIFLSFIFSLLLISSVSAVTLDIGFSASTAANTANITVDTIPLKVDQAIVNATGCSDTICLFNTSWINGNLQVNTTGIINWTSGTILTSQFPRLLSSSSSGANIASSLTTLTNANILLNNVPCDSLSNIVYTSATGSFTATYLRNQISCNGNWATLNGVTIDQAANGGNSIVINYAGCGDGVDGTLIALQIFIAIGLLFIPLGMFYAARQGFLEVNVKTILFGFVILSISLGLFGYLLNNIGSICT